ncbi:MAG: PEP/pyruvate-binding domain-containing protein [Thermoflexales bacterium]|nr:PEP/pyruvate-binding domain-containing protein [Thermoflexales bacterium]
MNGAPFGSHEWPKVLAIYLALSEYPILARQIRERMRQEMFARGIITPERFEAEVRAKAILTQQEEGLTEPLFQESAEEWEERLRIIRDYLTDFYFALNLPYSLFEDIVRAALRPRRPEEEIVLTFNPELAPWDLLFPQAEQYEQLPPEKREKIIHHLRQIYVVIIRGMISDQLGFLGVAREYFNITDLKEIRRRRIGRGKIGGKAAGMLLAHKILQADSADAPLPLSEHVVIPESVFLGADVFYDFIAHNNLYPFFDQKYKTEEEIRTEYPEIHRRFAEGEFPPYVVEALSRELDRLGKVPLIVRSSSLLEDNFGTSFAGKYESIFCPNQAGPRENLQAVLDAIRRVYASTLNPDALLYRRQVGLLDYDERMAVLIQQMEGLRYGRYFFPQAAGVAFSRNPFRWTPRIDPEEGFMRIVCGLGTRAVERVAGDYPRMVALSHPTLRPEVHPADIRKYSQHFIDVIDLEANEFRSLPISHVLGPDYPGLAYLASLWQDDYLKDILFAGEVTPGNIVLTFDRLLRERSFTDLMRAILHQLARAYGRPVDVEFTLDIIPGRPHPRFVVHLLQCRPLSRREAATTRSLPTTLAPEDILFVATRLVPDGVVSGVEYVVYVDPHRYGAIPDDSTRYEVGRVVGRINERLAGRRYILLGPGRWGSSNISLGVKVGYADIYNTSMLIEIAFAGPAGTPEVSYGTHFFQDLVEAHIYPLALYPDEGDFFRREFFEQSPNLLPTLLPADAPLADVVRVIHIPTVCGGRLLDVVMNSQEEKAVAYLRPA